MTEQALQVNGTTVYTFPNEHLHSFCIGVYVRAGSIFESVKDNGITHLLEHSVFRNINKKYGGRLYDLLASNGLSFSGCTYKEFLCFTIEGISSGFLFACEVLCSIFDKLSLNPSELTCEKKRIKAEIREKDQRHSAWYLFSQNIWKETNADKIVLGYCRVLDRTSGKALEEYRRKIFSSDNCFIYVTGCVTQENITYLTDKISRLDIPKGTLSRSNIIDPTGAFFHRERIISIKESAYCSVCMGFDTDTEKIPGGVLELMYGILFAEENALFYQNLSENNPLVYSYDSSHEKYDNIGCLTFNFEITQDLLEESLAQVVNILCDLKQGNFHFETNLNIELATWIRLLDDPAELNWHLAYDNHILNTAPIQYDSERLGRFSSVTKEAVMEAAKEIFTCRNLTILLEGKKSKMNLERLGRILNRLD